MMINIKIMKHLYFQIILKCNLCYKTHNINLAIKISSKYFMKNIKKKFKKNNKVIINGKTNYFKMTIK